MEKVTIYTNDFYHNAKKEQEVMKALKAGKAVRVGASCIGHTRAMMIEKNAEAFFEKIGAKLVEKDMWGCYYAL